MTRFWLVLAFLILSFLLGAIGYQGHVINEQMKTIYYLTDSGGCDTQ